MDLPQNTIIALIVIAVVLVIASAVLVLIDAVFESKPISTELRKYPNFTMIYSFIVLGFLIVGAGGLVLMPFIRKN